MRDTKIRIAGVVYCTMVIVLFVIGSAWLLALFNLLSCLALTAYWLQKYIRFRHRIEFREIVFLFAEFLCLVLSACFLLSVFKGLWIVYGQYIMASLHLAAATCFLGFMFLFKMKKLF